MSTIDNEEEEQEEVDVEAEAEAEESADVETGFSDDATEADDPAVGEAEVEAEAESEPEPTANADGRAKAADEAFCGSCGAVVKKEAEICPECGVRQQSTSQQKNPGIAAAASFFITGLGQIYNGQILKGIGLIVLQAVNFFLLAFLVGFLTLPLVWAYGVYDAYKTAQRINAGEITV